VRGREGRDLFPPEYRERTLPKEEGKGGKGWVSASLELSKPEAHSFFIKEYSSSLIATFLDSALRPFSSYSITSPQKKLQNIGSNNQKGVGFCKGKNLYH
jgi:hypothetical protein